MKHTIWLSGQQIGETKFEYRHSATTVAGAFRPTEFGLTVLPSITAMGPALFAFGEMCRRAGIDTDDASQATAAAALHAFAETPQGRRVLEAARQIAQVEVRDEKGKPVYWESLNIVDLDWMVGQARKDRPELIAPIEELPEHDIKFMITLTLRVSSRGTRLPRPRAVSNN